MFEGYEPQRIERRVADFWKKGRIYEKVKRKASKGRKFFFADGPPYATGNIHMGTAWNKIIKDTYIRYWRMKGFNVWDQPGYDSHGTPIEVKVEKELGFENKKDIEKYGAARFIKKCREFATRYIDVMSGEFSNLGVWMDWKNPYVTLHNSYIEGAWFTFKQAFRKNLLFKGLYPVHVCPRCETGVSYNEIVHKKLSDPSIFVKFPIEGRKNEYFVIWTTTPWTIPANTGIMVHPDFVYSLVEAENGEKLVIAKELVEKVMETAGIESYTEVSSFTGDEIKGMRYEHPLKDLVPALQNLKGAHRVVTSGKHVTLEEGTGLVHTAPGHGLEDYQVGMQEGLPMVSPVALDGTFTRDAGRWLEGRFTKDADPMIISKLSERGALLKRTDITHDYPTCWRCETPLLQMSVPQWFFRITEIRDKLIRENGKVNWTPGWAKSRFNNWLENLGDWPVSRQRYWGIPLPIWECSCGKIEVIGSWEELKRKGSLSREIDFHRPEIDSVEIKCPGCGKPMERTKDVLDVWFDSGVSTWAALGFPRSRKEFGRLWPADFETEGPDQFRGWWNSQMITSVLTHGKTPFRNVMLHGFVLDAKGNKMSKSKGNVVGPQEVIDRFGRDVLRFYLMSSAPWDDFYFNWESVKDTSKLFNVFWNAYQFVMTYSAEGPKKRPALKSEDRWIISRVNTVLGEAGWGDKYMIHKFVQSLGDFILNDFSRWYIKLVRNRVSPWYEGKDKAAAQYALLYVMERVVKAIAPVAPYISESIYQQRFGGVSVHAEMLPGPDRKVISRRLEEGMKIIESMIEAINAERQERKIKIKWPVSEVYVKPKDAKAERALKDFGEIVKLMGNVKGIKVLKRASKGMRPFPAGKLALGDVLEDEAFMREFIRAVQMKRKEKKLDVRERIALRVYSDKESLIALRGSEKEISSGVGAGRIEWLSGNADKGSVPFEISFGVKTVRFGFKKT